MPVVRPASNASLGLAELRARCDNIEMSGRFNQNLAPCRQHGAVSVWQLQLPAKPCADDAALLSEDEVARASRFLFAQQRARFAGARAFLRRVLGEWLGTDPARLVLASDALGRPHLRDGGPDFNLSHAEDRVVVAVAAEGQVGIDLEACRPLPDRDALARHVMDRAELAAFEALPAGERDVAFYRLWTRKEAVLKALGTGFSRDPRSLHIGIGAQPALGDAPGDARVLDMPAPAGFAMALCIRAPSHAAGLAA